MRDPYVWIDPFREIESLERAATYAREDGEQRVLRYIAEDHKGAFSKALGHAVNAVAQMIAEEQVKPHMARNLPEYEARRLAMELRVEALNLVAQPLVIHTEREGGLALALPSIAGDREDMTVSYSTNRPFQYSVLMSPMMWR